MEIQFLHCSAEDSYRKFVAASCGKLVIVTCSHINVFECQTKLTTWSLVACRVGGFVCSFVLFFAHLFLIEYAKTPEYART